MALIFQKVTGKSVAPMIDSQRYLNLGEPLVNNGLILITLIVIIYISRITYNNIELKGLALNKKWKHTNIFKYSITINISTSYSYTNQSKL